MPDGIFVAVVGPSGAGKDTLLNGAAKALAQRDDIIFVRRIITRPPDGATEDHDTLSVEAFQDSRKAGAFCLSWDANGLSYALPKSAIVALQSGSTVVANLSRSVLSEAGSAFGPMLLIEVTAAPHVLAARLLARGREKAEEVEKRLQRCHDFAIPACTRTHIIIDNSGTLDEGVSKMVEAIRVARTS